MCLQFRIAKDTLKEAVELGYINNIRTYEHLDDTKLDAFLESLVED